MTKLLDQSAYDPELAVSLDQILRAVPSTLTPDMIPWLRSLRPPPVPDDLIADRNLVHTAHTVPVDGGRSSLEVSSFARRDHRPGGLGIYYLHGGGMIGGDRLSGVDRTLEWAERFDAVTVSIEYRLAPENPDPVPITDCYTGLCWMAEHAQELGFASTKLVIAGASAGGGLAAGATLLARDNGGPELAGQMLLYPMLDDRNATVSSHQFDGIGVWDRSSNETGWRALLGDRYGTNTVSQYAAPARAGHLSGLPPTYADVGSAEVFRDETVEYASRMWAVGGAVELHVWAGAYHGCDQLAPEARVSVQMIDARTQWLSRLHSRLGSGAAK